MKRVKLIAIGVSLLALSLIVFNGVTKAQSVKTGQIVTVAASETVDSMLFAAGNNIDIAGTVNGDVYCAGENVTISGTVKGDVFCAGQAVSVTGKIEGSARIAGSNVSLSGSVGGSATIAAQSFIFSKDGVITRDLLGGVQNATLSGSIGRDLSVGSKNLSIDGKVVRNLNGEVENLTIGSAGRIGGDVNYHTNNSPIINNGGQIVGTVTKTAIKDPSSESAAAKFNAVISGFIYMLIALLILSLAAVLLVPNLFHEASEKAFKVPGRTALIGLAAVFLAPVLIFVLLVTVIGIPLGLLTLAAWLVVLLLSGPFTAYLLGRLILRNNNKNPVIIMLVGVSVLTVLFSIPFIGLPIFLVSVMFGVGTFLSQVMHHTVKPAKK